MGTIRDTLFDFVEKEIIPRYRFFDGAHQEDHANAVTNRALILAVAYPVNMEMVYVAAACHDLGLECGRENHHLESGRIIREMKELREWFDEDQIEIIAQAAEDHRASSRHEPRSIYGKIVAEADRLIEPEDIIRRTIEFGKAHYPELSKEEHWERMQEHLREKYAEGGYIKLWIPGSHNEVQLEKLRTIIKDKVALRMFFEKYYSYSPSTTRRPMS